MQARQTNKTTLHRESAILSWDRRWLDGKVYTEGVVDTAQKYVPEMRAKGADLIAVISHGGLVLANAYSAGDGVARDNARALAWYQAAAEREHPAATQALAMAYRDGELGLAPDAENHRQHMAEAAHALKHPALNP